MTSGAKGAAAASGRAAKAPAAMPAAVRLRVPPPPKMTVLLDTNVVLDVLLGRAPFDADAAHLLQAAHDGAVRAYIAAHAVTTVAYIVEQRRDRATAVLAITDLLGLCEVAPLSAVDFQRALALNLADFEDAVVASAAVAADVELVVTRNGSDFVGAPVTTRTAGEVLALLALR